MRAANPLNSQLDDLASSISRRQELIDNATKHEDRLIAHREVELASAGRKAQEDARFESDRKNARGDHHLMHVRHQTERSHAEKFIRLLNAVDCEPVQKKLRAHAVEGTGNALLGDPKFISWSKEPTLEASQNFLWCHGKGERLSLCFLIAVLTHDLPFFHSRSWKDYIKAIPSF
jgi:hypothetical protein